MLLQSKVLQTSSFHSTYNTACIHSCGPIYLRGLGPGAFISWGLPNVNILCPEPGICSGGTFTPTAYHPQTLIHLSLRVFSLPVPVTMSQSSSKLLHHPYSCNHIFRYEVWNPFQVPSLGTFPSDLGYSWEFFSIFIVTLSWLNHSLY